MMPENDEFESKSSIFEIQKKQFATSVENYKGFVSEDQKSHELIVDEETQTVLTCIPEEESRVIVNTATQISEHISDELFNDLGNMPYNTESLRALYYSVYSSLSEDEKSDFSEMYYRLFLSTADSTTFFSNNAISGETVKEDFFSADTFDRNQLYNTTIKLISSTMPVADYRLERVNERYQNYRHFVEKYEQKTESAVTVFNSTCQRLIPETQVNLTPTVFVDMIHRERRWSNDQQVGSEAKYQNLSASAIAFSNETLPDIELSAISLPYNLDEEKGLRNAVRTYIHESVHHTRQQEKESHNDWDAMMLEMVTDSATYITVAQSEGMNFTDDELKIDGGYIPLVKFAQELVRKGVVSEEEILSSGIGQDHKKFIELLDDRLSTLDDDSMKDLHLRLMGKWGLIPPVISDQRQEELDEFQSSPVQYLKDKSEEMWSKVGNQYLGSRMYVASVYMTLKERHPEWSDPAYDKVRDPNTGIMTDEAIKEFNSIFSKNQDRFGRGLVGEQDLLSKFDEDDIDQMAAVNSILNRLSYSQKPTEIDDGIEHIRTTHDKLSQAIKKVLSEQMEIESPESVETVLRDVVPNLFLDDRKSFDSSDEIVAYVESALSFLAQPVQDSNGELHKPTIDQILFWSGALNYE